MWHQQQLRRAAERMRHAALPDESLVRIVVARQLKQAEPQVHWQEEHEFLYRGQLYDVLRQHATSDSITYFCWHDHDEEKLLAGLVKHVQEYAHPAAGARKSAKKVFTYLFKLSYLLPESGFALAAGGTESKQAYPEYATLLPFFAAMVPFPPPWPLAFLLG
jgi:hypothetical protein